MTSRSSSPILILIGAVALSAVAGLFYLLSGEVGVTPEVSSAPGAAAPRSTSREPAAAEDLEIVPAADQAPRSAVSAEDLAAPEEEANEPKIAPEDLVWVEGRVVLAPDTPADERLQVLSLDRKRTLPQLLTEGGPAAAAWDDTRSSALLLDHALVDDQGRFRVMASRKVGSAILAVSGRYSYSKASRSYELGDEAPEVVLTAELGAWISGRVAAGPGTSASEVAGTEVGIGPDVTATMNTLEIGRRAFSVKAECDESGAFEFRSLPTTMTLGFVLTHDSRAAQLELGVRPSPGEHLTRDFTLTRGASLTGRVVDEQGDPMADIEVTARLAGPMGNGVGALRKATTDAEGAFAMSGVYAGQVELSCSPEGYRDGKLRLPEPLVEGEKRTGLVLEVPSGTRVAGHVHYPDGSPVVGADVTLVTDLTKMDAGMMGGRMNVRDRGEATTGERGEFEIGGLGGGPFNLTASFEAEEGEHAGSWRGDARGVSGDTTDLAIEVEGTTSISGRVIDLEQLPLESFHVKATLQGSGAVFGIGAERRQQDFDEAAEGVFELEGLRSGTWEVVVSAEGYGTSEQVDVVLPEPEDVEPLVFVLEPASAVAGTVLDTFGQAVAGARVSLEMSLADRMQFAQGGTPPEAITDFEGRFVLDDLEPGPCALVAQLEGFASSEASSVELVSGELTEEVVLQLRVGGLLTGEVLDDEGEPAVGRTVIVQRMPAYNRQFMMSSDSRGEFRFEHLEPGQWQVISMPNVMNGEMDTSQMENMGELLQNLKMAVADVVDGESVHIILGQPPEDPVKLTGDVLHAGEAVPNAVLSLVPDGADGLADLKMAFTDEAGHFEIDLDKRGDYLVTVQNNVGTGRQNSIEFRERIPEEGDEYEVRFDLPLGRISGHVEGADGDPAANCRITLNIDGGVAYGSFLGGHYTEITTDENGDYDIPYLRAGSYTVSAGGSMLGGMLGESGAVSGRVVKSGLAVDDGQWLAHVDFELARPGKLVGLVKDAAGMPVAGASVWVRDDAGRVLERFALVETDGSGRFDYKGLGPGTYTIFAKKGGMVSPPSAPTRLAEGGSAQATAILGAGSTLIVTVVDKTEAEVRARISVLDPDGNEMSGLLSLTEIMSQFGQGFSAKEQRVGPLPPGKYRVTATLDDGRSTHKYVILGSRPERKLKLKIK